MYYLYRTNFKPFIIMYEDAFKLLSSLIDQKYIDYIRFNLATITIKFTYEPKEMTWGIREGVAEDILELLETYK